MNRLRLIFLATGALVFGLVVVQPVLASIETLRDQIAVVVVVNVAASPIAYVPHSAVPDSALGSAPGKITASVSLHPVSEALQRTFHAEGLHFVGNSQVIAQAQVQNPVLVQAEVTPNPDATLLYSNTSGVTINATAGTTVQSAPCIFTVTVDRASNWSLDEGVSNDFTSGFPGTSLANNTYVSSATPLPTSTPYVDYATDGGKWSLTGTGTTLKTYCVTLTVKVPGTVPAGTYSTNAVYSLYF